MPPNIPSLKPKKLVKILERSGCIYYREGKGDRRLYVGQVEDSHRVILIDMQLKKCHQLMYCEFLDNLVLPMKKLRCYYKIKSNFSIFSLKL